MKQSEVDFRKILIKNLKQNHQWSGPEVLTFLSNFSKTPEFDEAYRKWVLAQKPEKYGPKKIKEIFKELFS